MCFSVLCGLFNRSTVFGVLTESRGRNYEFKTANYWVLTNKITIDNNWSDTKDTYDWCSGSGTINEPYTIENITINTNICIEIRNTNDFFIIKNSSFLNTQFGVSLYNVKNGIIDDCELLSAALELDYCEYITISNNIFETDGDCIFFYHSCNNNSILKNRINTYGVGIRMHHFCDDNIIKDNFCGLACTIWILNGCDKNIVENNTFSNVVLEFSGNKFNKVLNNTFSLSTMDSSIIRLRASFTTINNNLIKSGPKSGIELESGCDYNYIYLNTIKNCKSSIKLGAGSDHNTITSNTLQNCYGTAIRTKIRGSCQWSVVLIRSYLSYEKFLLCG